MARKKKMTAFKKNAVVFQSKRGRVLKKHRGIGKDLPKVNRVKGENYYFLCGIYHQSPLPFTFPYAGSHVSFGFPPSSWLHPSREAP